MEEKWRGKEAYRMMVENEKNKDSELNAYHQLVNKLVNAVLVLNCFDTHMGNLCVGHGRVRVWLSHSS